MLPNGTLQQSDVTEERMAARAQADLIGFSMLEMVLSEVLPRRGQLGDMCELPAGLITTVESAYGQLPVPGYPSWYDRSITVRGFPAPGKLLRVDGSPHAVRAR